jgi:hypothetical protein
MQPHQSRIVSSVKGVGEGGLAELVHASECESPHSLSTSLSPAALIHLTPPLAAAHIKSLARLHRTESPRLYITISRS